MSEEPNEAAPAAATTPPAVATKPQTPIALLAVIAAALIGGAAIGGLLVGPRLVAGRTAASAVAPKKEEAAKAKSSDDHPSVYKMDNVIVNPAGSQGLHFLMVSIAIEVPDLKMEGTLKAHEAELRDLAISILERQTMETLNRPGAREGIKHDLETAISAKANDKSLRVFLPQFVIQ